MLSCQVLNIRNMTTNELGCRQCYGTVSTSTSNSDPTHAYTWCCITFKQMSAAPKNHHVVSVCNNQTQHINLTNEKLH